MSAPLLRALDLPVDGILLDAGGGTGRVATALRDHTGLTVVVDISLGMMQFAMEKDLDCLYAPVESLPFASETIDRIVMMDALHHVKSQVFAAADLFRVLKPGGRLVVIEPDIRKFVVKLIAFGEKILLMRSKFFTGEQIGALFSDLGAKIEINHVEHNVWVIIGK